MEVWGDLGEGLAGLRRIPVGYRVFSDITVVSPLSIVHYYFYNVRFHKFHLIIV